MKENKCFCQVSWNRCHIVRLQGDWRKICQTYVSSLTNKQNEWNVKWWETKSKRKNLKFALNRYIAMKEGKEEKKNSWNHVISVNFEWFPANPSQILPTFCQDNKVKPWKFEKRITKIIVRLMGGRKKGRKKLNKQTNKENFKK